MMYRLAKGGLGQSGASFSWRNEKHEFMIQLAELTTLASRDPFRPNLFVNTPDSNPRCLQTSARLGLPIRAALVTTLSGSRDMAEGFELPEATALSGKENALASAAPQLHSWYRDRLGNMKAEIARRNAVREASPPLQTHLAVVLHNASDDAALWYPQGDTGSLPRGPDRRQFRSVPCARGCG